MNDPLKDGGVVALLLAAIAALWRWLRHLDNRRSDRIDQLEEIEAERLRQLEFRDDDDEA